MATGLPLMRVSTNGADCQVSTSIARDAKDLCSILTSLPKIIVSSGNGVLLGKRDNTAVLVSNGPACLSKSRLVDLLGSAPTAGTSGVSLVARPSTHRSTTKDSKLVSVHAEGVELHNIGLTLGNGNDLKQANDNCKNTSVGVQRGGFGLCLGCSCCRKGSIVSLFVSHTFRQSKKEVVRSSCQGHEGCSRCFHAKYSCCLGRQAI